MALYSRKDLYVKNLIENISSGVIGLPELQRPFVWPDTKSRDLLISMLKGYPIGFVIMWQQPNIDKKVQIGINQHAYSSPNELIIDGQQRLTSLYSILTGVLVKDKSFNNRRIILSYNPFTDAIEVANDIYKKSPEWIYDLTEIFTTNNMFNFTKTYVEKLQESKEQYAEKDINELMFEVSNKVNNFKNTIIDYQIPILDIGANVDEEDVADIFVNINNGGQKLNQSDFILTLISVHYPIGRQKIEEFCMDTTIHNLEGRKDICNPIIAIEPKDIVRIVMSYGFKRGKLKYAYKLLRGADFERKGIIDEELRVSRFNDFEKYLEHTIDRNNFIEFLKCVNASGFVSKKLIPSTNNIIYAYTFWLVGKYELGLSTLELKKVISRLIYFFILTSRYSTSFESKVEDDLNSLLEYCDGCKEKFETYFNELISSELTNDYYNITLPKYLETSNSINPGFLTYIAAQNILEAKVLFSNPSISTITVYNEWMNGTRNAVELHHLFPKQYLKDTFNLKTKDINQVANYAFIEWVDNMKISDVAPNLYLKDYIKDLDDDKIKDIEYLHALPFGWENLEYFEFLNQRRKLMSNIIKKGFEKLLD